MGRKIKWSDKPIPKTGYYYICNNKRKKVIVLYMYKRERIAEGDMRSLNMLNIPDPPNI